MNLKLSIQASLDPPILLSRHFANLSYRSGLIDEPTMSMSQDYRGQTHYGFPLNHRVRLLYDATVVQSPCQFDDDPKNYPNGILVYHPLTGQKIQKTNEFDNPVISMKKLMFQRVLLSANLRLQFPLYRYLLQLDVVLRSK